MSEEQYIKMLEEKIETMKKLSDIFDRLVSCKYWTRILLKKRRRDPQTVTKTWLDNKFRLLKHLDGELSRTQDKIRRIIGH